ncbi:hypothetical protein Tco_1410239 [Tanacetum coccineum]
MLGFALMLDSGCHTLDGGMKHSSLNQTLALEWVIYQLYKVKKKLLQEKDSFIVSKKRSSDSSKKLKGIQTLTPAKQEAADIMKALKESKKMSKRQPRTGGSKEGTGTLTRVPDESPQSSLSLKVKELDPRRESHYGSMSSMKNLKDTDNFGDQFLYDKPTEDDQEKSKVVDESDSTIPDPSHQTVTSTPPVIAPFTEFSYPKPSSLVTPPPINTDVTIHPSPPRDHPFIALQLRVARLEQEMSNDKVDLEEFDLKSALFKHMNKIKLKTAWIRKLLTRLKFKEKACSDDDEDDDDVGLHAGSKPGNPEVDASAFQLTSCSFPLLDGNNIPMQDEGHVSDLEDTDNAHSTKVVDHLRGLTPIPEDRTGKKNSQDELEVELTNIVKGPFIRTSYFFNNQLVMMPLKLADE